METKIHDPKMPGSDHQNNWYKTSYDLISRYISIVTRDKERPWVCNIMQMCAEFQDPGSFCSNVTHRKGCDLGKK